MTTDNYYESEKVCELCGVPDSQHNTCCGWDNANVILFPWEFSVPAMIPAEEKELRYRYRNDVGKLKELLPYRFSTFHPTAIPLPEQTSKVKEPERLFTPPDCSQHPKELFGEKDMKIVGEAIANMNYESLPQLFYNLSKKLERDAENDHKEGRENLADAIQYLQMSIFESALRAEKLWKISKPFMDNQPSNT